MLITPSFKKGLIVEQFQGNYLNYLNYLSTLLRDVPFTWQPRATVMLVKKVWYLRRIYCSFAVRENLNNIATIKYSHETKNWIYCTFDTRQKLRQIWYWL